MIKLKKKLPKLDTLPFGIKRLSQIKFGETFLLEQTLYILIEEDPAAIVLSCSCKDNSCAGDEILWTCEEADDIYVQLVDVTIDYELVKPPKKKKKKKVAKK